MVLVAPVQSFAAIITTYDTVVREFPRLWQPATSESVALQQIIQNILLIAIAADLLPARKTKITPGLQAIMLGLYILQNPDSTGNFHNRQDQTVCAERHLHDRDIRQDHLCGAFK